MNIMAGPKITFCSYNVLEVSTTLSAGGLAELEVFLETAILESESGLRANLYPNQISRCRFPVLCSFHCLIADTKKKRIPV